MKMSFIFPIHILYVHPTVAAVIPLLHNILKNFQLLHSPLCIMCCVCSYGWLLRVAWHGMAFVVKSFIIRI